MCDHKPGTEICNTAITKGATTTGCGVGACPVSLGKVDLCSSIHKNATPGKKDTATNNALGAKIKAKTV